MDGVCMNLQCNTSTVDPTSGKMRCRWLQHAHPTPTRPPVSLSLSPQTARKISVAKFRAGKVPLMIVTDVAARGIDIPLLDNVINYDFPSKPKLFVHR